MNWIKDKVLSEEITKGMWISSGSSVVGEIASRAGFDWLLLDMEHGLGSESETLQQIQCLHDADAAPIVRIPACEAYFIKRILDFGASGIMVPMVNTADDARRFIKFLRYPPDGIRGMSGSSRAAAYGFSFPEYHADANKKILAIVQIETRESVDNVFEIAAVDGVDILFVGHSDLSLNLGCFREYDSPLIIEAERKVRAACEKYGKKMGMILRDKSLLNKYKEAGFSFFSMGTDIGILSKSFKEIIS